MTACLIDHPERTEAVVGLLCLRHRRRLDDILTEIGELIVDTQRIVDGGAPQETSPKTRYVKAPAGPAPADLVILALYDRRTATQRIPDSAPGADDGDNSEPLANVLHTVASWLLCVAEERPLSGDLPRSVLAQLALLARHGDWIAAQLWVDDLLAELADVRKALRSAVHEGGERAVGRCPSQDPGGATCNGPLFPVEGEMAVDCRRCHRHYGEDYLRHLGGMLSA